jgi:hypothetical protein
MSEREKERKRERERMVASDKSNDMRAIGLEDVMSIKSKERN